MDTPSRSCHSHRLPVLPISSSKRITLCGQTVDPMDARAEAESIPDEKSRNPGFADKITRFSLSSDGGPDGTRLMRRSRSLMRNHEIMFH
jgi:hypothetical protein